MNRVLRRLLERERDFDEAGLVGLTHRGLSPVGPGVLRVLRPGQENRQSPRCCG